METKRPASGEWYRWHGHLRRTYLRRCVGEAADGEFVMEDEGGDLHRWALSEMESHLTHMPDCTGFDWVEPVGKCPDCGEPNIPAHADVCPEAWVTQDQVPDRPGVDDIRWTTPDKSGPWYRIAHVSRKLMHGFIEHGLTFEVR